MRDAEVVVYGASGYTGKNVAWKLSERGIPFIAAGRNKKRLREQLGAMAELKNADYECVEVEHSEPALCRLLKGKKIIHNLVGPFMQLAGPVVKAALASGCHYLDASGEQDWMRYLQDEYADQFSKQGLLLSPACASMYNSGYMAAELCLETAGVDSVDILYALRGVPSVASTLSFMRMCCQPQYYLENNQLVLWEAATTYQVSVPGSHQNHKALPWSGCGESIWYQHDPRVMSCSTLVTFMNPMFMNLLVNRMREFNDKYKNATPAEQEAVTNQWALEIAPSGEPPREDYNVHRNLISCHGRGETRSASVELRGVTGYVLSGAIAAITIDKILGARDLPAGMLPAAKIAGVRAMLNELGRQGLYGAAEVDSR